MLRIDLRRRQGFELADTARRNEGRSYWYRLIGMRRWALILMVADRNFVSEWTPRDGGVDDFEVVAEDDRLTVACPDLCCQARQTVAQDWHSTIGELIRAARAHVHSFPDETPEKETRSG